MQVLSPWDHNTDIHGAQCISVVTFVMDGVPAELVARFLSAEHVVRGALASGGRGASARGFGDLNGACTWLPVESAAQEPARTYI